ncbi:hypothetical protein MYCTH_2312522 [Thermothelomyces thermophilus ATCC 42464]|uniref:Glutamyl-tRNA amidotransferase complex subunit Gta3 domain-containing protein n=1 Tax=Thermothelomyces thermophilus (strain ATCC 42464 / BCRC 31852 / DSM 1799) TaxID=573729 RepID=G2QMY4_THET4|nr:uncharacterized protein MYCTH_2312522 [Thermothelomyces thermophilus ATCC 42464]AEO61857.1 hypothetical protein MYCTH_2312522 [Thermothelomyces thermophilus ATCC 42464]
MASPWPCRALPRLAGTLRLLSRQTGQTRQSSSSSSQPSHHDAHRPQHDPYALLSKPTWSVRTLLPPSASRSPSSSQPPQKEPSITPDQLSHLLRLSALPQPADDAEARRMLADLDAQLHFVRDVQRVDTDGVDPLPSIRDETPAGLREATVTVDTLRHALAEEEVVGRCRRPRRRRTGTATTSGGKGGQGQKQIEGVEDWDVLGCAAEKVGRYFVVRSGKGAAATSNGFVEGFDRGS